MVPFVVCFVVAFVVVFTLQSRRRRAVPPLPAPGWFPDPRGRFDRRFWDGLQWTEQVERGGEQSTDPV